MTCSHFQIEDDAINETRSHIQIAVKDLVSEGDIERKGGKSLDFGKYPNWHRKKDCKHSCRKCRYGYCTERYRIIEDYAFAQAPSPEIESMVMVKNEELASVYWDKTVEPCGLDPMTTNLVVEDASRMEKTIWLAVPGLKSYRIPGRARLFEVVQQVKQANTKRLQSVPRHRFNGAYSDDVELKESIQEALSGNSEVIFAVNGGQCFFNTFFKVLFPSNRIFVFSASISIFV